MQEFISQPLSGSELVAVFKLSLHCNGFAGMEWQTELDEQLLRTYLLTTYKKQRVTPKNVDRVLSNAWMGVYKSSIPTMPDMLVVHWYCYKYFWHHLKLIEVFYRYPTHLQLITLPINPKLIWIPSDYKKTGIRRQGIAMEQAMKDGYTPPPIDWQDPDYDPEEDEELTAENGDGLTPYLAWWKNSRIV